MKSAAFSFWNRFGYGVLHVGGIEQQTFQTNFSRAVSFLWFTYMTFYIVTTLNIWDKEDSYRVEIETKTLPVEVDFKEKAQHFMEFLNFSYEDRADSDFSYGSTLERGMQCNYSTRSFNSCKSNCESFTSDINFRTSEGQRRGNVQRMLFAKDGFDSFYGSSDTCTLSENRSGILRTISWNALGIVGLDTTNGFYSQLMSFNSAKPSHSKQGYEEIPTSVQVVGLGQELDVYYTFREMRIEKYSKWTDSIVETRIFYEYLNNAQRTYDANCTECTDNFFVVIQYFDLDYSYVVVSVKPQIFSEAVSSIGGILGLFSAAAALLQFYNQRQLTDDIDKRIRYETLLKMTLKYEEELLVLQGEQHFVNDKTLLSSDIEMHGIKVRSAGKAGTMSLPIPTN